MMIFELDGMDLHRNNLGDVFENSLAVVRMFFHLLYPPIVVLVFMFPQILCLRIIKLILFS